MSKQKMVLGGRKITKYKLGGIAVFYKEKTPTVRRIRILGFRIIKVSKRDNGDGSITREIFLGNVQVAKIKKNSNKVKVYLLGIPIWKRKTKPTCYKYYLFGITVCKRVRPVERQIGDLLRNIKTHIKQRLSFPKQTSPVVSIIIPVYNQYEYTIQCLNSILAAEEQLPYEIIIADDNSTDKTKSIARYIKNIKVMRNKTSLGYVKNCNNAAKLALGKYIYFLNNDTIVQKNWLTELLHVFEIRPDAGVVGSKIYNHDQSLQECGVFMFADLFMNKLGSSSTDSRHMYLKPVDYVSGCSLLTPKKLFDEIGGFDELFAPAYSDDPDYCLAALQRGYRTYVQPKSHIIHFGEVSYDKSRQALMEHHRQLLFKKWRSFFATRGNFSINADSSGIDIPPVILIVDDLLPQFDKHAGGKTIFQYCQMFIKMGLIVKFCPYFGEKDEPYFSILADMGIEVIERSEVKGWIDDNYHRLKYLFLSRPQVAEHFLIKQIRAHGVKVLYYGHDLHHLRLQREQDLTGSHNEEEIAAMKEIERLTIEYVDWAYYPSKYEEQYIKREFHCKNVSVVAPYLYETLRMPAHQAFAQSANLLFVGNFYHGPNRDGLIWFIDDILPLIREQLPELVLNIVGAPISQTVQQRAGKYVKILGYQTEAELTNLYASTKLAIAPLRYGAGVKGKIIDAIYHRTPVITTGVGAEGINLSYGCIGIADTAEEFASLLVKLYTQKALWDTAVQSCQQFIADTYSFEKAVAIFSEQITPATSAVQGDVK